MSEKHGAVWWTELGTRDVDKALAYYGEICGWAFESMPMEGATYHVGKHGERPIIGIMDLADMQGAEGVPPHWLSYFAVDDLDGAVAKTREMGGDIRREPFDVPGVGKIAIVADPTGAVMGLITPADSEPPPG